MFRSVGYWDPICELTTHKGFFSAFGSKLCIGSPSDHVVAHLLSPVAFPFVTVVIAGDVVPSLAMSA